MLSVTLHQGWRIVLTKDGKEMGMISMGLKEKSTRVILSIDLPPDIRIDRVREAPRKYDYEG